MQLPNIVHPRKFSINGYVFQVVSYIGLTDQQAAKIAMHGYRSRKWLKKNQKEDQKKIHSQLWMGDQDSLGLLG